MAVAPLVKSLHNIHPGEWYFGGEYERLHTVLGSCVALTAWHPKLKIGGLCHYLLAVEPKKKNVPAQGTVGDCRYAVHALALMKKSMLVHANIAEYQLGLFGGGDMFAYRTSTSIGQDNIAYACQWLRREKLQPMQTDVGGDISRSLVLVMSTGEIQLKHYQMNQR
jgi:chemotaxis protein CheD